jgi:hypothetical protein
MHRIFATVLGLVSWVALTGSIDALGWGGGEYERALRPGAYVPFDGASYSQRYAYETGSFFYPTMNPNQLIYLEYLDRLDRAQKFGYQLPRDPYAPGGVIYEQRHGRGGFGLFRWRDR